MKKTIITLLAALTLCACIPRAYAAPGTSAVSVILYEADSGTVLLERNADARMLIASTTKIMTALVVLENKALDEIVDIKPEYTGIEGSSMYLTAGEKLTVRELLYGLMLSSGNDAAVALACYTAGGIPQFAKLMNERAAALGCGNSSFKNPHGLDADGHYSSARDLAMITSEAMKLEAFRDIASTKNITIAGRSLQNHNKLLWSCDGMVGGKTGYTKNAGRSLVTCVERDGMPLVCVTLSDPNDWADHTALYDWAYASYKCVRLNRGDTRYAEIPVISGLAESVAVRPGADFRLVVPMSAQVEVRTEAPRFVYAGVVKGARAGKIIVNVDGVKAGEVLLVYCDNVKLDTTIKLTLWEQIKRAWFFANSKALPYSLPVY